MFSFESTFYLNQQSTLMYARLLIINISSGAEGETLQQNHPSLKTILFVQNMVLQEMIVQFYPADSVWW